MTSQISVAARRGADQLGRPELGAHATTACAPTASPRSRFGLFGLELDRRSRAAGWGITSNLSHPGVAPTSLLAARPEIGRSEETSGRRLIRCLSSRGILLGTVETAAAPGAAGRHRTRRARRRALRTAAAPAISVGRPPSSGSTPRSAAPTTPRASGRSLSSSRP